MLRTGIMASECVETAGDFMERIRWGILGAGSIAQRFVAALARVEGAELVAISGRNAERLSAFAAKHRVDMGKCYASADDNGWKAHECLLLDDDVDAVYIAPPHGLHATWSCWALRAGKAVLCEKPAVLTGSQADEVRLRIGDVPVRLDFSGDSQAYKIECRIDCERGSILVPMFHRPSSLLVTRGNGEPVIEDMPLVVDDFYGEVEHFCGLMRSGKSESPIMPLASTVRTAQIIDAIRAAWDPRPVPHQA